MSLTKRWLDEITASSTPTFDEEAYYAAMDESEIDKDQPEVDEQPF